MNHPGMVAGEAGVDLRVEYSGSTDSNREKHTLRHDEDDVVPNQMNRRVPVETGRIHSFHGMHSMNPPRDVDDRNSIRPYVMMSMLDLAPCDIEEEIISLHAAKQEKQVDSGGWKVEEAEDLVPLSVEDRSILSPLWCTETRHSRHLDVLVGRSSVGCKDVILADGPQKTEKYYIVQGAYCVFVTSSQNDASVLRAEMVHDMVFPAGLLEASQLVGGHSEDEKHFGTVVELGGPNPQHLTKSLLTPPPHPLRPYGCVVSVVSFVHYRTQVDHFRSMAWVG